MCLSESSALINQPSLAGLAILTFFFVTQSALALQNAASNTILLKCMAFLPRQSVLCQWRQWGRPLAVWHVPPSQHSPRVRAAALWPPCRESHSVIQRESSGRIATNRRTASTAAALGEMLLTLCWQWACLLFITLNYDVTLKISVKQVGSLDDALHFMWLFLWMLWCKHTGSNEANESVQ